MNMNSLMIITDQRRVGGMLNAVKALGGPITAAVVGPRSLADTVSAWGFERVLCLEPAQGVPAEAYSAQVAEVAAAIAPRLLLASDAASSRMLLAAAAAKLNANVIGAVRALSVDGDAIVISRSTADDKVLEDIEAAGSVAGIFSGADVDVITTQPVSVEQIAADSSTNMRLIGVVESEGGNGMLTAARVVGVGAGLAAKDDLKLIEELAAAARAEIGCSLPVCEDLRWLSEHRVIGSSHSQVSPELYIALGISGQPQHMTGVRDAKIVVAINNDPEARVFKFCNYGIIGDLYKIVPALISAFKNMNG